MQRRSFRRPGRAGARAGLRPTRLWAGVSGQFAFGSVAVTSTVTLIQLQAPSPASFASLTSDPPEDLTILRMVGDFTTVLTVTTAAVWTLALTVADVTWTPGATSVVDADKRLLWVRTFDAPSAATWAWRPPGYTAVNNVGFGYTEAHHLDIAPKVKVEAGKALYLVAYEESGDATLLVSSVNMRVLMQRTGR